MALAAMESTVTIRMSPEEMHRQRRRGKSPVEYANELRNNTDWPEPITIRWGIYDVLSPSGETYRVVLNSTEQSCTCQAGKKDKGAWGSWDKCWHRAWCMLFMLHGPRRVYDADEDAAHRAACQAYKDAYIASLDRAADRYEASTGDSVFNRAPGDLNGPDEYAEWSQTRRVS